MQNLKHILTVVAITFISYATTNAQTNSKLEVNPTITSKHYWRGIMVNNSANIETDITYSSKRLNIGVWGGYAFNNKYSEFDLHLSYKITKNISLSVWDLYASRDRESIDKYNYFDLKRESTNHLIDATLSYNFGNKLPLTIKWSTMLWGRDLDINGNQRYSSYAELEYRYKFKKTEINCFAGLNVFRNSMYAKHTNIVNTGIKIQNNISVMEKAEIPVWAIIALNPDAKTANMILGISFRLN
ncbi:MAG: hypothetical protein N4A72_09370 [Bacteroidales bacterium]|jgi:predicted porin|nr:hypothetical protein [Bacteroidales bacterium]